VNNDRDIHAGVSTTMESCTSTPDFSSRLLAYMICLPCSEELHLPLYAVTFGAEITGLILASFSSVVSYKE
jgi:hypothetical protein